MAAVLLVCLGAVRPGARYEHKRLSSLRRAVSALRRRLCLCLSRRAPFAAAPTAAPTAGGQRHATTYVDSVAAPKVLPTVALIHGARDSACSHRAAGPRTLQIVQGRHKIVEVVGRGTIYSSRGSGGGRCGGDRHTVFHYWASRCLLLDTIIVIEPVVERIV